MKRGLQAMGDIPTGRRSTRIRRRGARMLEVVSYSDPSVLVTIGPYGHLPAHDGSGDRGQGDALYPAPAVRGRIDICWSSRDETPMTSPYRHAGRMIHPVAMEPLNIPQGYRDGFKLLAGLSDGEFASLSEAVAKTAPATAPSHLSSRTAARAPETDAKVVSSILRSVLSVGTIATSERWSYAETADAVGASADLSLSEDERAILRSRLANLFGLATVRLTIKAQSLATEYPYTFCDARIVTDVRPLSARTRRSLQRP